MNRKIRNMYAKLIEFTWNPITGSCPHECLYCFVKALLGMALRPLRINWDVLDEDLGSGHTIFVCSSLDLMAEDMPKGWILQVLNRCTKFANRYFLQSKNPRRFLEFKEQLEVLDVLLFTTIETNRRYVEMGDAPAVDARAKAMAELAEMGFNTGVTIEPILDFDLDAMVSLVEKCHPQQVFIGRDSKHICQMHEPAPEKVIDLCLALQTRGMVVTLKSNLLAYVKDVVNKRGITLGFAD